jgi:phenylpyruvate tautomerase PptA (4-oxalocrotonate tautomerase family)
MPLVRIDLPAKLAPRRLRAVADAVHAALVAHMNVPEADRFQIITRHQAPHLLLDPHYPSVERTADALVISVVLRAGRTDAQKQAFYRAVVEQAAEDAALRPDDIMIALSENSPLDWSFGRGEALYAPTVRIAPD